MTDTHDGRPLMEAKVSGGIARIDCVICGQRHTHGRPAAPDKPEHRAAHCPKGMGDGGYYIVERGSS
jgi:hypothetical protein